jgi:L-ascorbate metabolism protein UlaG (beta-lactamase superfamily)
MTKDGSYYSILEGLLFAKNKPTGTIPSLKTDLLNLDPAQDVLVWFGHSSYFMKINGKKFLVDPVLSGSVSPIYFTTRAFKGTDPYTVADIPSIDYLIITHDHWDHLDYRTLLNLKLKVNNIITPLGVGNDFIHWGFSKFIITETDWGDRTNLGEGFTLHTTPARHFSGRAFIRNQTLWASYVLETPTMKLFIGGDGGYDTHFKDIGERFGSFDLAILEDGQYNKNWKYIHMSPNEVLQAAKDLNAKRLIPVHNSKFTLSIHPWFEPLELITRLNTKVGMNLVTPRIGEQVNLTDQTQVFKEWWKDVR